MKRTFEQEQIRQMKIISAQMSPLTVIWRVGLGLFLFLLAIGLLSMLFLAFSPGVKI
jgi:hypothetical protein